MSINLRKHLENEKRFSWIPLALLSGAIIFILSYSSLFPSPQLYEGYIRLEPASDRGNSYISFHVGEDKSGRGFMVLLKDPAFYARVEAMLDKKVQVKALLSHNEPADFDKIEIFEIKERKK